MPSSSSRSATSSTTVCVSCTSSETRTAACARWNSHRSKRHDDRRGARGRADRELARRARRPPSAATSSTSCSSSWSRRCAPRYRRHPASVGSTRRPDRSRSCAPSRFSSARTCSDTAGCVTPSRSAACEKLRRSTTAQNAASWRVSISERYLNAPGAVDIQSYCTYGYMALEHDFVRCIIRLSIWTHDNPFAFGALALDDAFVDREHELRGAARRPAQRSGRRARSRRGGTASRPWRCARSRMAAAEGVLVAYCDLMRTPTKQRFAAGAREDDPRRPRTHRPDSSSSVPPRSFRGLRVRPTIEIDPDDGGVPLLFRGGAPPGRHRRDDRAPARAARTNRRRASPARGARPRRVPGGRQARRPASRT